MPVKTQEELKMLSPEQRKENDKQLNRERVNRYRQANKDTEEYKLKHKEQTYKYRKEHPDTIKKLNQKHSKAHKDKVKQTKLQTQTTASTTIQNAIRNKLARNALQNRKQELLNNTNDLKAKLNATEIANDFLNSLFPSVINALPETRQRVKLVARRLEPTEQKKRGRPVGSKNKPKN